MFRNLTRAAALTGFAALAAVAAVPASAETIGTAADSNARVEYRYLGQGAYAFVTTPRLADAPYALTGRDRDYWNRNVGQFINTGQGRYYVPATR
ncbi:MAG: hypothetical protein JWN40_4801 [Phycisphaerales bacterium]|nr:hypothetical protein [Phycisphaerales bacterium]